MADLNSILSDEGDKPADVPVVEMVETPDQTQEPAADATGDDVAATPAETQEANDSAKGLQAALMAERRKRQEYETRLREYESKQAKPAVQSEAPNPDNFQENPQEYWRQLARYEARQELNLAVQEAQKQATERAEQERIAKTQDRLNAAVAIGQSKFRDFDAVVNGGLAPYLSDTLREEIAASESGADIAYWLGKNPAVAQRLAALDPRSLAREVVKLEAKAIAPPKPVIPQTLTQVRDTRGQFANGTPWDGPTPLDALFARK